VNLYTVTPFPDAGFRCDEDAQQQMLVSAQRKDKLLIRAFVGMAVSFAVALGFGVLRIFPVMFVSLAGFAACFVVSMVRLFIGPERHVCRECGQRMEFAWRPLEDGRGAEYLICERCRRFVYTFRTSR
jgi:hypothetical protein